MAKVYITSIQNLEEFFSNSLVSKLGKHEEERVITADNSILLERGKHDEESGLQQITQFTWYK